MIDPLRFPHIQVVEFKLRKTRRGNNHKPVPKDLHRQCLIGDTLCFMISVEKIAILVNSITSEMQ